MSEFALLNLQQLKSYLEDGQLSLEGGILTPTTLTPPTPGTPLTSHTSAYTHYLLSEYEPVSTSSDTQNKPFGLVNWNQFSLLFFLLQSALPHVSADVDVVRFGYCAPQRSSDGQVSTTQQCTYVYEYIQLCIVNLRVYMYVHTVVRDSSPRLPLYLHRW